MSRETTIVDALNEEIMYCLGEGAGKSGNGPAWEQAFIEGLKQALLIVKEGSGRPSPSLDNFLRKNLPDLLS